MKEFPGTKLGSGPHGLVEDKDGNIWFTPVSSTYIGKLDPKSGAITEYPLPEGARGPHTPIFDQKGTLFATTSSMSMAYVVARRRSHCDRIRRALGFSLGFGYAVEIVPGHRSRWYSLRVRSKPSGPTSESEARV
jgi:streptogramin lyase